MPVNWVPKFAPPTTTTERLTLSYLENMYHFYKSSMEDAAREKNEILAWMFWRRLQDCIRAMDLHHLEAILECEEHNEQEEELLNEYPDRFGMVDDN